MRAIKTRRYSAALLLSGVCLLGATVVGRADDRAEKVSFALTDSFGREVRSQDYAGVPVYLEFGASW